MFYSLSVLYHRESLFILKQFSIMLLENLSRHVRKKSGSRTLCCDPVYQSTVISGKFSSRSGIIYHSHKMRRKFVFYWLVEFIIQISESIKVEGTAVKNIFRYVSYRSVGNGKIALVKTEHAAIAVAELPYMKSWNEMVSHVFCAAVFE